MKNNESLLENNKNAVAMFFVRHMSGLYVGRKAYQFHWYLHVHPEHALKFKSRAEAEKFIESRAVWLQEFLEVVPSKVYADCTQDEKQEPYLEHGDIKPWRDKKTK